ncbi:uncharacterized protein LOC126896252 isoform X1 [Daktulosphaira vitifoliae]|uniref:uncharacterized protein LOC126896252 isoform X1 n=1 Tax=Daktulosphaira vitifoliae TaxID=58002 RepID=UPI0021A9AC15|nr:uncharacterized protein LOC126896252 isoform X1 [Daktulosphaira vitifoliae]
MFELNEEFDLDDEIFLSTQILPNKSSVVKIPNTNCISSPQFDQEEDDDLFNISSSVYELNSTQLQNNEVSEHNDGKNHKNLGQDAEKESKNQINSCVKNHQFQLDADFDSDDEAFFNSTNVQIEALEILNSKSNNNITALKSFHTKESNKSICHDSFNTTISSVKTMTPKCISRKFPGPAGLLTEKEDLITEDPSNLESLDASISITENEKNDENLNLPSNESSFSSTPYQQFLLDFSNTDINILLEKYNVAWIKQKLLPFTASGRFFTDKIPFFVSVIQEIDCLSPDPSLILVDKTGLIKGTIHRDVWTQFSSQLKIGTILVLSNVGVSCQRIVKGFTLNITNDHLIAMYSHSPDNFHEVVITRMTSQTNEEIINTAKRWHSTDLNNLYRKESCEVSDRQVALINLKFHDTLSNSVSDNQPKTILSNVPQNSSNSKSFFTPKIPVSQILFKNTSNTPEEPPAKKFRKDFYDNKSEDKILVNEVSAIQSIFEEIDDAMFGDFYC